VLDPVAQNLLDVTIPLRRVVDDGLLRGVVDDGAIVFRDRPAERPEILDVLDGDGVEVAALVLAEGAEKAVADDLEQYRLD
jgi:hypothetical protein